MPTTWYSIDLNIENVANGNTSIQYFVGVNETNTITNIYNSNFIGANLIIQDPSMLAHFTEDLNLVNGSRQPPFWDYQSNQFVPSTLHFELNRFIAFYDPYLQSKPIQYKYLPQQTPLILTYPYFAFYSSEWYSNKDYNATTGLITERNTPTFIENMLWVYQGPDMGGSNYFVNIAKTVNVVIQQIGDGPSLPEPIPCFKKGTKILTRNGYKLVELLTKNDLIKTFKNGYKRISMIGSKELQHYGFRSRIADQLYKCSRSKYPELTEDLVITGGHSILVNNFISEEERTRTIEINGDIYKTEDKYRLPACVDHRAEIYDITGEYTIYHIALENNNYYTNYGVYANGLLVESCSKQYLKEHSGMRVTE